ncbi:Uncharacterised protein [Vibrio cholerae]|nr:Uncharacterised protein [Vibrio cholerae]
MLHNSSGKLGCKLNSFYIALTYYVLVILRC